MRATILMTDLEDSTWLWEHHADVMEEVVLTHADVVRLVVAGRGVVVKSTGDGVMALFAQAGDAIRAAVEVQRRWSELSWAPIGSVAARIGVNTGECRLVEDDVLGPVPNLAARLQSAGHGGQILLSESTACDCAGETDLGGELNELGPHLIRSFDEPVMVYMVDADGLRSSFPPLRVAYRGFEDLPADDRDVFGRDQLIAMVGDLLRQHRLVTLWGPGGVGKTRISIRLATRARRPFQDGVRFVDLRPASTETDVVLAVLAAFRAQTVSAEPPHETLARALGATRVLVVLDNCEHVLDAARSVATTILESCPGARILTTSREPLAIWPEHAVEVFPLPVPSSDSPAEEVLRAPAVQLFLDRAEASRPGFSHVGLDARAVAELCQAAAGLPLALELLGARVGVEGLDGAPADVVHRLVTGPMAESLARTLAAIGERPRELFCRLSLFEGSFDRSQAMRMAPHLEGASGQLDHLVRTAVVQKVDAGRFRVLEPFRAVGLARLEPESALGWRRAHARLMLERAEDAAASMRTDEEAKSAAQLGADFADHRAAFGFLMEEGALDDAARLAIALFQFCFFQPRPEGHRWVRTVAERCTGKEPWAAEALGAAALASWYAGDSRRAIKFGTESVEASTRHGSDRWARMALADAYGYSGDIDAAVPHYVEVVRAARDDEPFWQVHGLGFEAVGLAMFGNTDAALAKADEALARARALANPDCTQWAFYALGRALTPREPVAACEAFEAGMRASASVGSRFNVGVDLVEWVALRRTLGDLAMAITGVLDLLDLLAVSGNRGQLSQALREVGGILADAGDVDAAALALLARQGLPAMPRRSSVTGDDDEALLQELHTRTTTSWTRLRVQAQALSEPELLATCREHLRQLQSAEVPGTIG
jgi:predicted ATPase/class 3 adenylate cyclase